MSSTTPDPVAPAADPAADPALGRTRPRLPFWAQVFIGLAVVAKRNGLLEQAVYDANTFGGADARLELDEDETVAVESREDTRVAVSA